jgi:peptidoglycan/LPS O-acetylase OafA/YrhL
MSEKKNLDSVQILRGVAAFAVVAHHACQMVADNGPRPGFLNQLGHLRDLGAAGVDIFFVISGFIMVYVSRRAFGQPGAATEFWRRRVLRIVPLYWIYTTAMLALTLMPFAMQSAVFSPSYTLKSYLFIPDFVPGQSATLVQPLLTPGWTLFYEMFFYLVFGLWLRFGQARTLVPFLLGVFVLCIGGGYAIGLHRPSGLFLANAIIFEFLYGVVIGIVFLRQGAPPRGIGAACIALAIAAFAVSAAFPADFIMRSLYWGVPAALLVHGSLAFQPRSRLATAWVHLGDASYSVYLLHGFITLTGSGVLRRRIFLDRVPPDLLVLATIAACVAAGWWAYLLIEKPLTHWIAARFPGPEKRRAVSAIPEAGSAA